MRTDDRFAVNNLSEDEIIAKMLNSKTGDRIRLLLVGGWEKFYTSQSEADLALANDLAFWTGRDFSKMDSIFRGSSLMRPKWDEKHGKTTYGVATLNKAINETSNVYHPERERMKYDLSGLMGSPRNRRRNCRRGRGMTPAMPSALLIILEMLPDIPMLTKHGMSTTAVTGSLISKENSAQWWTLSWTT